MDPADVHKTIILMGHRDIQQDTDPPEMIRIPQDPPRIHRGSTVRHRARDLKKEVAQMCAREARSKKKI